MKLKTLSRTNRPAMAFVGFPFDPTTLIIQLILFLVRYFLGAGFAI
jgi:hypothetical protein